MRMTNRNKALLTMGSAILITSASAIAGPPIGYDQYTATTGTIIPSTTFCDDVNYSCGNALTGNGFLQRSVTDLTAGTTYFQTIILPMDANVASSADIANLAFADENFVQQGGGTGIADKQSNFQVHTTSNPGDFSSTTAINSGWAQGTGESVVHLTQSIDDTYNASTNPNGKDFVLTFTLDGDGTKATSLNVNQSVSLCAVIPSTCTDKQVMDVRRFITSASGTTTPALPTGDGLTGNPTISWVTGNIIQAVWLGQAVTTSGTSPDLSGFLGYSSLDAGSGAVLDTNGYSSQTITGPDFPPSTYDTTDFGTAPTF